MTTDGHWDGGGPSHVRELSGNPLALPVYGDLVRPDFELVRRLEHVSAASLAGLLNSHGIRDAFIRGPRPRQTGRHTVGVAVTLQFLPIREDVFSPELQEAAEEHSALWHVMEQIQPGDLLAIQAYGDPSTGCIGEMLATYLQGRQAAGVVVDGCIRDAGRVDDLALPVWSVGATPNYASQCTLFPYAYNVPIAMGGTLVLPGDVIVADDDGAVVVPKSILHAVIDAAEHHEKSEEFSRQRLAEGGDLARYYPLNDEGRREYESWLTGQSH